MDFNGFIKGCCVIRIEGENLEVFLNEAAAQSIPLWELRAKEDGAWVGRTEMASLAILRGLAHKCNVYFQVTENKGLFQFIRSAKRRWYPLVIALLVLGFLVVYSQSILNVRISSDISLSKEEETAILDMAEKYGVAPTLFCDESRWEGGANAILNANEKLSWVGFQKDGVLVTVKIIGKKTRKDDLGIPGNIVAKKDCVVRKIFVLRGEKIVEPDTPVKQGELLIGANIIFKNTDGEPSGTEAVVHADGIVEGSIWYTAEIIQPTLVVKKEETGNYANAFYFTATEEDILLWGTETRAFENSITRSKEYAVFGYPIFFAKNVSEVVAKEEKRSLEETKKIALKKASKDAKQKIPQKAKIVDVKEEVVASTENYVKVRVTIETYENLGCFQSLAEDS